MEYVILEPSQATKGLGKLGLGLGKQLVRGHWGRKVKRSIATCNENKGNEDTVQWVWEGVFFFAKIHFLSPKCRAGSPIHDFFLKHHFFASLSAKQETERRRGFPFPSMKVSTYVEKSEHNSELMQTKENIETLP